MINQIKTIIQGFEFKYDPEQQYQKDGHIFCKKCNERVDSEPIELMELKFIRHINCKCDREAIERQKRREHQIKVDSMKSECFISNIQKTYKIKDYKITNDSQKKIFKIINNYIENYEIMRKDNIGLLLYGNVGSGKTYLACSIANAIIEKYQYQARVRNFSQIINDLQKSNFDIDKNNYIEGITNTPLLILDDLGIERNTSYALEQVYNIINSSYLKRKPTIITTNLSYDEIENDAPTTEYQRIYSRVNEMCIPVMVVGDDYRKNIKKEKLKQMKELLLSGEVL